MNRTDRWMLDVSNLLVGGTGMVYAIMVFLMAPTDEWAIVNHPWQPHLQHLHVLAAPLLVFVAGLFWKNHVLPKYRDRGSSGRRTGLTLGLLFLPMVVSGYLIQVSVSETWRSTWTWVHLITSVLWLTLVIAHRFSVSTKNPS